jgi:hypothetical protein
MGFPRGGRMKTADLNPQESPDIYACIDITIFVPKSYAFSQPCTTPQGPRYFKTHPLLIRPIVT